MLLSCASLLAENQARNAVRNSYLGRERYSHADKSALIKPDQRSSKSGATASITTTKEKAIKQINTRPISPVVVTSATIQTHSKA